MSTSPFGSTKCTYCKGTDLDPRVERDCPVCDQGYVPPGIGPRDSDWNLGFSDRRSIVVIADEALGVGGKRLSQPVREPEVWVEVRAMRLQSEAVEEPPQISTFSSITAVDEDEARDANRRHAERRTAGSRRGRRGHVRRRGLCRINPSTPRQSLDR